MELIQGIIDLGEINFLQKKQKQPVYPTFYLFFFFKINFVKTMV